jgi:hypothetical protein
MGTGFDFSTADKLTVDDFGVVVRGRSYCGEVVAPSSAGDGWSVYAMYRCHIVRRGPWQIYEVNLQTEEVSVYDGTNDDPQQILAFPDGRIYVPAPSALLRLNAEAGRFDALPLPFGDYWFWRPGRDSLVYLCGEKRRVLRFDQATDSFEDFGPVGHPQGMVEEPPGGHVTEEGERLTPFAVDSHCMYVTTGQIPRALWAVDLTTREQRSLLCIIEPDRIYLSQREEGCYAVVERQGRRAVYRLTFENTEEVDGLPPLTSSRPTVDGIPRPDLPAAMRGPETEGHGSAMCGKEGLARIDYRPPDTDWRSVTIDLSSFESYLFRMGSTADGRLLCSSEDPYTIFTVDPKTGRADILGPSPLHTHVYGFAEAGDKIYFVGYWGAKLFAYDPSRPWNYQPGRPDTVPPPTESEAANPQLVARVPMMRRAYDVISGADGRLYIPCSTEFEMPCASGGGLGWFDPATGEVGLVRDGFIFHRAHTGTTACDGRYIVVSTTAWWVRSPGVEPETSGVPDRVVTFDVETGKVVGDLLPADGMAGGGEVVEWQPGKVVGRNRAAEGTSSAETIFYILDVASQQVESVFRLAGSSSNRLLPLPDGRLWGYHDGGVFRLDPETWTFEPVCQLDKPPRDWRIVNGQIFAFHDTHLVRYED